MYNILARLQAVRLDFLYKKGVKRMSTFEALMLMLTFALVVIAVMRDR